MVSSTYPMAKGKYGVHIVDRIAFDRDRHAQQLSARVYFPKSGGTYPVIIWSHGLGFNKNLYQPLAEFWATHGFIIICANHLDAISGKCVDEYEEIRTRDLKFIIDELPMIVNTTLRRYDICIDNNKVGMGGHCLGAHTAQLIGGVKKKNGETFSDKRPKAFLLISPRGTGGSLDKDSWHEFDRPVLVVTGTEDKSSKMGKPYAWRMEGYHGMPPNDKFLVLIQGAHHGFGGITGIDGWRGSGPANKKHVEAVQSISLLFWNGYLKCHNEEIQVLRSMFVDNITKEDVRITWK